MLCNRSKFSASIVISLFFLLTHSSAFAAFWQHALKSDDIVQLQNSTAQIDASGKAQVRVHAWVYERERRPGARTLFARYLGLDMNALSATERAAFSERTSLFLIYVQKNKTLTLSSTDGGTFQLSKTDKYGAVNEVLTLPMRDPNSLWIDYAVQGPNVRFAGRALRVPNQGISIVSDVDDTIRITNVLNRHEMLMNTFVRPLKAVPDMARLYQSAAAVPGLRFHYVSNAPYALYPLVEQFLQTAQFPEGSMHLRAVSFKSSIWRTILLRPHINTHKTDVIETLISDFPDRRFILIGDTGEQDPEIYAALARAHPLQVRMILLRNVAPDGGTNLRLQRAMHGIPAAKWLLFSDAETLNLEQLQLSSDNPGATP